MVTLLVISTSFVFLVAVYARGDGGVFYASTTSAQAWSAGRPGWPGDVDSAVGLRGTDSASAGKSGGLFTVRLPHSSGDSYRIRLYLINADQVLESYRFMAMCVRAVPAVSEFSALVEDRRLFVEAGRLNHPEDGACDVISAEQIATDIRVEARDGTVTDRFDRTAGHPDFARPVWRVFAIGITDGTLMAKPDTRQAPPRFIIDVNKA